MAETNADIGFGVELRKETATPGTYAAIGVELTSVTPASITRDSIDATHHTSPDGFREFIPGLLTAGECQVEGNYIPSAADEVIAAMTADTANWRIVHPNAVTETFKGFFTAFEPGALTVDGKMTFSATLKLTGKQVFA